MPRVSALAQTGKTLELALKLVPVKIPMSNWEVVVEGALLNVWAFVLGRNTPTAKELDPETAVPTRKPAIDEIESLVPIEPDELTFKLNPM